MGRSPFGESNNDYKTLFARLVSLYLVVTTGVMALILAVLSLQDGRYVSLSHRSAHRGYGCTGVCTFENG